MIGGITAKHDSNALMDEHQHIAVCIRIVSLVGSIAVLSLGLGQMVLHSVARG
jgi:hypothetical protein